MPGGRATRLIIMGAAGRDFHDFNVYWRHRPDVEVVCFTAAQIPNIAGRVYPAALAGPRYPAGIPIFSEDRLEDLIRAHGVDQVTLAYSDISHETVMHQACRAQAAGAEFHLLCPLRTMVTSRKPVIAVCSVRTGCGKSQVARRVARLLSEEGRKVAVVRHPMPYGDLAAQRVQRFATLDDLDLHHCTVEEREEYEPHIAIGGVVFAGVDYVEILRRAEDEADVILWDGGNNDTPFFKPSLHIVVADPHRPGHELRYYPGELNLRMADFVIINKIDSADAGAIEAVEANVRSANPRAALLRAASPYRVADPALVAGRRVLVIEDGPTLTHGEMPYGVGYLAARRLEAAQIVDPGPYAVGSIADVFRRFGHLKHVLPAMGYGAAQLHELETTIAAVPCDTVLVATPIDLARILRIGKPSTRVTYELDEQDKAVLPTAIGRTLTQASTAGSP